MKSLAAVRCLVMATMSLITATLPLAGIAQETLPAEAPATPEPASQSSQATAPSIPQQRFVSDKLVLNVYAEPDQGSSRVATIQTGDALEELERMGNMVRVRLEDGREGWVGASYLVNDPPAVVRLRELQRQAPSSAPRVDKALVDEIAQLKKENTTLRGRVSELQARITAPVAAAIVSEKPMETLPAPATQVTTLATTAPSGAIWSWLIAMVAVGGVSFVSGYQSLARRLRKKFGALKVY
jgi:uncharacterized protein YgiM (DUF1202 family)